MGCHVWLLKYRWFDMNKNKNHRTNFELGYKSINTIHFLSLEELVILAIQTHRVFYIDNRNMVTIGRLFELSKINVYGTYLKWMMLRINN